MVFPAAIREKSQRGVALSCDVHVVSAKSVGIRHPSLSRLAKQLLAELFFQFSIFARETDKLEMYFWSLLCLLITLSCTLIMCLGLVHLFVRVNPPSV